MVDFKHAPRKYQQEIASNVLKKGNTLVVLPTGLGKTLIAFLVMEKALKIGATLFLAPTKPLVNQHLKEIKDTFKEYNAIALTGEIKKKDRKKLWEEADIIVATPQTVEKDLNSIDKDRFSLVVLDEVHRTSGKYAYSPIAIEFKPHALLLGLTASPGSKKEKINEIKDKLAITNVEIRDYEDEDVKPYVKEIDFEWVNVLEDREHREIKKQLNELLEWYKSNIRRYGFKTVPLKSRKGMIFSRDLILKSPNPTKYQALKYLSASINLDYAIEMLETQSMGCFLNYIQNMNTKETKGTQILLKDGRLEKIVEYVKKNPCRHPKTQKLIDIINKNKEGKYIVFSQYTAQIEYLDTVLSLEGFKCKKFIGQRKGNTRKQQMEIIKEFRNDEFNVLIASSIGEEGLDIPSVDYVIFYEPIPSEIRSIQRRGRAGRHKKGFVKILITKGTRDETYLFASKNKEKKMKKTVKEMSEENNQEKKTGTLRDFF
jgi:ERCC4-related helicase